MTGVLRSPADLACPVPFAHADRVLLGHGSGGKLSGELFRDHFLPRIDNPILARLGDAAVFHVHEGELAFSTDTFVVSPIEFPGGNIGALAVHGTLNDLAMMGATPRYLSTGFVIEEGLPLEVLDRVIAAMAQAAREAGVPLVTGDTKVVERGKADQVYINTTGVGTLDTPLRPAPDRAVAGVVVLVSGPIGRHGMAIMAAREGLAFESEITSDAATLYPMVARLGARLGKVVHVLRDPTRGGVASALNEIAAASKVGIELTDGATPVPPAVSAACEMLGLDPLYVASEGVCLVILPAFHAEAALETLREHPLGAAAAIIGRVVDEHPGMVILRTGIGGSRVVDLLPGDQLPRIC